MRAKAFGGVDQIGEAAAETSAGHLIGRDSMRGDESGIHQVLALVVQDCGRAQSAALQNARGCENQRGLSGAKKAAERNEDRALAHDALFLRRYCSMACL